MDVQQQPMSPLISEGRGSIIPALIKAQGKIETIVKTRTADIRSDKGNFKYAYADLAEIRRSIQPIMTECELAYFFIPWMGNGKAYVQTVLMHTSGEYISNILDCRCADNPQAIGSAQTYLRRYGLTAVLGLAAGEDDDGGAAEAELRKEEQRRGMQNGRQQGHRREDRPENDNNRTPAERGNSQTPGERGNHQTPAERGNSQTPGERGAAAKEKKIPTLEQVWAEVKAAGERGWDRSAVAAVLKEHKASFTKDGIETQPEDQRQPTINALRCHPSWAAEKEGWCNWVKENGMDPHLLGKALLANGKQPPQFLDQEHRLALSEQLINDQKFRARLEDWMKKQGGGQK